MCVESRHPCKRGARSCSKLRRPMPSKAALRRWMLLYQHRQPLSLHYTPSFPLLPSPPRNCCPSPYGYGPGGMIGPGDTTGPDGMPSTFQGDPATGTGWAMFTTPSFANTSWAAGVGSGVAMAAPVATWTCRHTNHHDSGALRCCLWSEPSRSRRVHLRCLAGIGFSSARHRQERRHHRVLFGHRRAVPLNRGLTSTTRKLSRCTLNTLSIVGFSAFIDMPYRAVHFGGPFEGEGAEGENHQANGERFPEANENQNPNNNTNGFSDLQLGFKYALYCRPGSVSHVPVSASTFPRAMPGRAWAPAT